MKNISLNYSVPFNVIESFDTSTGQAEFFIQGIAINSTVTDNNHKFIGEELEKSVGTLRNRPLLKDHNDSVDSIVGKVIIAEFNEQDQNIIFKARINDTPQGKGVKELIKSGDLSTVSIGAGVKDLEETENGELIPRGIKFKELSLVATPADDDAQFTFNGNSFTNAIKMAWNTKETVEEKVAKEKLSKIVTVIKTDTSNSQTSDLVTGDNKLNKGHKMEEDKKNEVVNQVDTDNKDIQALEIKLDKTDEALGTLSKKVDAQVDVLSQILVKVESLNVKEADVDEEPEKEAPAKEEKTEETEKEVEKEEPKEESKEAEESVEDEDEDEEDEVDEKNDYKIIQTTRSFSVLRNKY